MAKVMFQFRDRSPTEPALEEVQRRFGFTEADVDRDYGIIQVDSRDGLYVMMVEEAARERVAPQLDADDPAVGFFSNPRIEPFGPPSQ